MPSDVACCRTRSAGAYSPRYGFISRARPKHLMDTIALLSHGTPTAVIAYRAGVPVTAQGFLSDARHLAQCLPKGNHVLNVCADRYRFTVGVAACLMTGRVSLLPSTHTPEVIGQLSGFAPDAFCLTDDRRCDIDLPRIQYPQELP